MVSRYVKQRTGKAKLLVGVCKQRVILQENKDLPIRQHRVFSMFHCPKDNFSPHLVTCLQSLYADLKNIWAGHLKLLASIHRLSTQLYIEVLIVIYLVSQ